MSKLKSVVAEQGLSNVATALGVSSQRLSNWIERGVPVDRCYAVERATGGAVTRQDLRDDWREIWPELAEKSEGCHPMRRADDHPHPLRRSTDVLPVVMDSEGSRKTAGPP